MIFPRPYQGALQTSPGPTLTSPYPEPLPLHSLPLPVASPALRTPSLWKIPHSKFSLRSYKFHSLQSRMSVVKRGEASLCLPVPQDLVIHMGRWKYQSSFSRLWLVALNILEIKHHHKYCLPSFWSSGEIVIPPTDITLTLL